MTENKPKKIIYHIWAIMFNYGGITKLLWSMKGQLYKNTSNNSNAIIYFCCFVEVVKKQQQQRNKPIFQRPRGVRMPTSRGENETGFC